MVPYSVLLTLILGVLLSSLGTAESVSDCVPEILSDRLVICSSSSEDASCPTCYSPSEGDCFACDPMHESCDSVPLYIEKEIFYPSGVFDSTPSYFDAQFDAQGSPISHPQESGGEVSYCIPITGAYFVIGEKKPNQLRPFSSLVNFDPPAVSIKSYVPTLRLKYFESQHIEQLYRSNGRDPHELLTYSTILHRIAFPVSEAWLKEVDGPLTIKGVVMNGFERAKVGTTIFVPGVPVGKKYQLHVLDANGTAVRSYRPTFSPVIGGVGMPSD